jgi:hypothetical protein
MSSNTSLASIASQNTTARRAEPCGKIPSRETPTSSSATAGSATHISRDTVAEAVFVIQFAWESKGETLLSEVIQGTSARPEPICGSEEGRLMYRKVVVDTIGALFSRLRGVREDSQPSPHTTLLPRSYTNSTGYSDSSVTVSNLELLFDAGESLSGHVSSHIGNNTVQQSVASTDNLPTPLPSTDYSDFLHHFDVPTWSDFQDTNHEECQEFDVGL